MTQNPAQLLQKTRAPFSSTLRTTPYLSPLQKSVSAKLQETRTPHDAPLSVFPFPVLAAASTGITILFLPEVSAWSEQVTTHIKKPAESLWIQQAFVINIKRTATLVVMAVRNITKLLSHIPRTVSYIQACKLVLPLLQRYFPKTIILKILLGYHLYPPSFPYLHYIMDLGNMIFLEKIHNKKPACLYGKRDKS